ncbi:MAG: rod shape-determining protein MreD [Pseudomonadota bacterium]
MRLSGPELERRVRSLFPLIVAVFAVLVDLAPRPAVGAGGLAPSLTLGVVFFWSVYRPDVMSYGTVFAIGLLHDVLSGLPLGLSSLALLFGRAVLMSGDRFFHAQPFAVIWVLFIVWAPAVEGVRYVAGSLLTGAFGNPATVVFQAGLTIALYPALSWFLVRLHQHVVQVPHAKP